MMNRKEYVREKYLSWGSSNLSFCFNMELIELVLITFLQVKYVLFEKKNKKIEEPISSPEN